METLLRLLLPLKDRVWKAFLPWVVVLWASSDATLSHSMGSTDVAKCAFETELHYGLGSTNPCPTATSAGNGIK